MPLDRSDYRPAYSREYTDEGGRSPARKNQIYFVVDNQTPFTLSPNYKTFADWGDFTSGPVTVKPFTTSADVGHIISSVAPFVGSAGMVGFTITNSNESLYIRLLGSNPYMSVRDNWACVKISSADQVIDQDEYNEVYYAGIQIAEQAFAGSTLKVTGHIGQAINCTATFVITHS